MCKKICCGVFVLLLGILLLLKDVGVWDFWKITPWTLVFLVVGTCMICRSVCKCCEKPEKKKK